MYVGISSENNSHPDPFLGRTDIAVVWIKILHACVDNSICNKKFLNDLSVISCSAAVSSIEKRYCLLCERLRQALK